MIGVELDRPAGALVQAALDAGLILNVTAQRVIRLLPPLIVDDAQVDQIASTVAVITRSPNPGDERGG